MKKKNIYICIYIYIYNVYIYIYIYTIHNTYTHTYGPIWLRPAVHCTVPRFRSFSLGPIVVAGFVLVGTQAPDTLICQCCSTPCCSVFATYWFCICCASAVSPRNVIVDGEPQHRHTSVVSPGLWSREQPQEHLGPERFDLTCSLPLLATIISIGRCTMQQAAAFLVA